MSPAVSKPAYEIYVNIQNWNQSSVPSNEFLVAIYYVNPPTSLVPLIMVSRVVFEIKRRHAFPEAALIASVVMPAQHEGLRGEFSATTTDRYTAVLEGRKEAVTSFMAYLETLEAAVGEVSGMTATHHHEKHAFSSRLVRMVFPE